MRYLRAERESFHEDSERRGERSDDQRGACEDGEHLSAARTDRTDDCDRAPPLTCDEREHLRERVDADEPVEERDTA